MFAKKLCVKTFQVKNVPLTLTLSLDLKTSILIVDGFFLYHITEGLGVDVSLVMIRVILKKKVVLCCYRTLESIIFDFCQVSLLCYLWTYISIHISTYTVNFNKMLYTW